MTTCNRVTTHGNRKMVLEQDIQSEIDETMEILIHMKNSGMSWRGIAHELNGGFSHTLIRKVALGLCKSDKVSIALGVKSLPKQVLVEPCRVCGEVHKLKTCSKRKRRKRYRVALEFSTKRSQDQMIEMLQRIGDDRIRQSKRLFGILDDFLSE